MDRKQFLHGLCYLSFILGWAHPTCAGTYYVAADGQDGHPGTQTQPWRGPRGIC
jgi:hypothetical protein